MRWNPHKGANKRKDGKRRGKRYWSYLRPKKSVAQKLLLSAMVVLLPAIAFGQGTYYGKERLPGGGAVPYPLIYVCTSGASLTTLPCPVANRATIYTSETLSTPKANPFRGDADGSYQFSAAAAVYVISVGAPLSPGYSFKAEIGASGGGGGTGSPYEGPNAGDLWFDVTADPYNTPNNCVDDATTGINLAITAWAASSTNPSAGPLKMLYFPPPTGGSNGGCYLINGTINWPNALGNYSHTILMNGRFLLGTNGRLFDLNTESVGPTNAADNLTFVCQGGGASSSFTFGTHCDVLTISDTRTLPIVDARGNDNLKWDGFVFNANGALMTEAVLQGTNSAHQGSIHIEYANGFIKCTGSTSCIAFRNVAPTSDDAMFDLKFHNVGFEVLAGGTYSGLFQNIGSVECSDCYWGNKGWLLQETGNSAGMGQFELHGAVSLSENLTGPLVTVEAIVGDMRGLTIGPMLGMADNIGPQYTLKVLAGSIVHGVVMIQGGAGGSGFWDPSGICPVDTHFVGLGMAQLNPITSVLGCQFDGGIDDTLVASQSVTGDAFGALLVPHGMITVGLGGISSNTFEETAQLRYAQRCPAGGAGIPRNSIFNIGNTNMLFDCAGSAASMMAVGNTGSANWASQSPNGHIQNIQMNHSDDCINFYLYPGSGGGQHFFCETYFLSPGTVRFTNNSNIGIFTGASLSGTRTYTLPNLSGYLALNPGTTLGDTLVCLDTATPCALGRVALATTYVEFNPFDFNTTDATGDGAYYFAIPPSMNGKVLVSVSAKVGTTVGTTGTMDIQLARCSTVATGSPCSGTVVDMLSTKLTIDSNEEKSSTAATPAVINTSNDDLLTDQEIRVDVDAVHTTPAKGLRIILGVQ